MKNFHRWALKVRSRNALTRDILLGPYCWWSCKLHGLQPTRTFRTRAEARVAKDELSSYRRQAQPVKVVVTVTEAKP